MNPDYIFLELLNIVALREKAATGEWCWVQKIVARVTVDHRLWGCANERQGSKNLSIGSPLSIDLGTSGYLMIFTLPTSTYMCEHVALFIVCR